MIDAKLPLIFLLVAAFYTIGLASLEFYLIRRKGLDYPWDEVLPSIGVAIGRRIIIDAGAGAITLGVLNWGHTLRMFDWPISDVSPQSIASAVVLFFLVDFLYYWHHRLMHQVRWFWADHAVHHSANKIVMPVAERIGWFAALTGIGCIYLPAVLVGFTPSSIIAVFTLNLLYQYWIHTELVGHMGWWEKVLNTPSHHRVHHASNANYLDSNYGGVFIIFDRIFGTFKPYDASEPIVYGLVKPLRSTNPFRIALHEWTAIIQDLSAHWRKPKLVLNYLFGKPGWSHDGSRLTSQQLKIVEQESSSPPRAA